MVIRSVVLGIASLTLIACEPVESTGSEPATEAAAKAIPMPSGLTGEQQGLWNTFSDAGKKVVSECMETGKSFAVCTAV